MIEVTDKAKLELCEKFSIDVKALTYLGGGREDSDGTVYTYIQGNQKKVFKILAIKESEKEKLKNLEVRIQFANYLGENGIQLAYPLTNTNGNLYEIALDKGHYFIAYVMNFYEGINPTNEEVTDKLVYKWGKLTGKSHAITVPAQGIMFDITGGMNEPFHDKSRLKRFYDSFLNGYETENHLESKWLKEIDTFINYRRMLLFTCMQDWLNTEPKLKLGFIRNILNPTEFHL